jgi:hypothetical protein
MPNDKLKKNEESARSDSASLDPPRSPQSVFDQDHRSGLSEILPEELEPLSVPLSVVANEQVDDPDGTEIT